MSRHSSVVALLRARIVAARNRIVRSSWRGRLAAALFTSFLGVYGYEVAVALGARYAHAAEPHWTASASFALLFVFGAAPSVSAGLQALSADEATLLGTLPVSRWALFVLKLWDTAFFSLRFFILSIPVFLAFALVGPGMGVAVWVMYGAGWVCFWWLGAACGMVGAVAAIRAGGGRRSKALAPLLSASAVVAFFAVLAVCLVGGSGRWAGMDHIPERVVAVLRWFPTTWIAGIADSTAPVGYLTATLGSVVVALGGAYVVFERAYDPEQLFAHDSARRHRRARHALVRRHRPVAALILKECLATVRDRTVVVAWLSPIVLHAVFLAVIRHEWRGPVGDVFLMNVTGLVGALFIATSLVGREGATVSVLRTCLPRAWVALAAKVVVAGCATAPLLAAWAFTWGPLRLRWTSLIAAAVLAWSYAAYGIGVGALVPASGSRSGRPVPVSLPGVILLYAFFAVSATPAVFLPSAWLWSGLAVPASISCAMLAIGGREWARRDVLS